MAGLSRNAAGQNVRLGHIPGIYRADCGFWMLWTCIVFLADYLWYLAI